MRRTASEVIRELEMRVARLEREAQEREAFLNIFQGGEARSKEIRDALVKNNAVGTHSLGKVEESWKYNSVDHTSAWSIPVINPRGRQRAVLFIKYRPDNPIHAGKATTDFFIDGRLVATAPNGKLNRSLFDKIRKHFS